MSNPSKKNWFFNRLAAMSCAEILYRLKLKVFAKYIHKAILKESLPNSVEKIVCSANFSRENLLTDLDSLNIYNNVSDDNFTEADEVLAHNISLFGNTYYLGKKINWYYDSFTGFECPRLEYFKLNYRNIKQTGDIMHIWWLNRQQHLIPAAIAYFLSKDEKYADEIISQIQKWLDDCPYPKGPAWLTGIEVGIRLITWSWIYKLLFANGTPKNCSEVFLKSWFISIRQHVRFINSHWAKFSSANNHTIAEAVGIIAATTTWPNLFQSKKLLRKSAEILINETFLQNSPDGVNKESATSYHAFVLELLTNACILHQPVKFAISDHLSKMADFLHILTCDCDCPPDIGDSDNAVATGFFKRDSNYYKNVITAAKQISNFKFQISNNFSSENFIIYNSPANSYPKLKLCMNVGKLGYGSLAAHGHADALAFTLHVNGEPVFIDPGTYAYHADENWRNYFRGTHAHNTLAINKSNQGEILGPFLWGEKYFTKILRLNIDDNNFNVEAEHTGYIESFGAKHRRQITKNKSNGKWIIRDEILANGDFFVQLMFHIHPDRKIEQISKNVFKISGTGYSINLTLSNHLKYRIACGETSPPLGWFSPVLYKKIPSPTIIGEAKIIGCDNLFSSLEFVAE